MAELRRGLPRIPGGEAWPPAGVVAAFAVVAPGGVNAGSPPSVEAASSAPAVAAAPESASESQPAPAAAWPAAAATLRRGMPRAAGGEAWPPAGAVASFSLPEAAGATPDAERGEVSTERSDAIAGAPASSTGAAAVRSDAPSPADAPARPSGSLRRGLPRTPGGSPWPAAGTAAAFEVAAPRIHVPIAAPPPPKHAAPAPADAEARTPTGETPVTAPAAEIAPAAELAGPATVPAGSDRSAAPAGGPAPARSAAAARVTAPARVAPAPRKPARFTGDQVFGAIVAVVAGGTTLAVIGTAVVFLVRIFLFASPAGADFLRAFPGESALPDWAPTGFPAWVQWQHWLNAFFIVLVIKTGLTVRRTQRPAAMWQPRRGKGKKISIELWSHLALDVLWLANGVIFWVLLFATGQWVRVVPTSWDIFPNALSAALQYVSLSWPTEDGWVNYNALQTLAYFVTIFLAAPLAAITGFRMSPLWPAKAERLSKAFPVEWARAVHFPTMLYFVAFVIVHVILVLATGALRNLNHMFWGSDDTGSWGGFWLFVLGIVGIIAGWIAVRPAVMKYVGAAFGRVGR